MSKQTPLDIYANKRYADVYCSSKIELSAITAIYFNTFNRYEEDNSFLFEFKTDSTALFRIYKENYCERCYLRLNSLNQINNIMLCIFGAIFDESIVYVNYRRDEGFMRPGKTVNYRRYYQSEESCPFEQFKYPIPIKNIEYSANTLFSEDLIAY